MTNEQLIEKQLNEELVKFSNSVYAGKVEVPKNILEIFKVGLMAMSPYSHKINFNKVKVLLSKKVGELTYADLNDVVKVVINTVLDKVYSDIETAVKENIKIEKFVLCFNEDVSNFQEKLKMRKANLLNLSSSKMGNGMRIIPQA